MKDNVMKNNVTKNSVIKNNVMKKRGLLSLLLFTPFLAQANDLNESVGAHLSLWWGIPFVSILLSIAFFPLLLPRLWHHHYGKIILCWTLLFLGATLSYLGGEFTLQLLIHALIGEYLPFILLLLSLFTVSGGILVQCNLPATPKINVLLLTIGTLLASIMGTTGAAMLMIRPLIRVNRYRAQRAHIMIFFIFLVANIGGGLTPLGDPPLFIGFLKGVDFFWTVNNMLLPVVCNTVILLMVFYGIDRYFYKHENDKKESNKSGSCLKLNQEAHEPSPSFAMPFRFVGIKNVLLLLVIVLAVLLSGIWRSDENLIGLPLTLPNLLRDGLLIVIMVLSRFITPQEIYRANEFNWAPIIEVAKLFMAIFITITPVLLILRAGYAPITSLVMGEQGEPFTIRYFWLSGLLSGFLDNAPTYLVFFNLAAGDAQLLMTQFATTLLAISMGSVFMGALTYIGNAPNLMIKAIAEQNHIIMPSFFGYMKWSIVILIPLFLLDTLLFLGFV